MNRQLALRSLRNLCTFIGAIALFSYFYNWTLDLRHWYVTLASALVCLILWIGFYVIETRRGVAQLASRLSRPRTSVQEPPSPANELLALSGGDPAIEPADAESLSAGAEAPALSAESLAVTSRAPAFVSAKASSHDADFDAPTPIEELLSERLPLNDALPSNEALPVEQASATIETSSANETPARNPLPWLRPRRSRAAIAGKDSAE